MILNLMKMYSRSEPELAWPRMLCDRMGKKMVPVYSDVFGRPIKVKEMNYIAWVMFTPYMIWRVRKSFDRDYWTYLDRNQYVYDLSGVTLSPGLVSKLQHNIYDATTEASLLRMFSCLIPISLHAVFSPTTTGKVLVEDTAAFMRRMVKIPPTIQGKGKLLDLDPVVRKLLSNPVGPPTVDYNKMRKLITAVFAAARRRRSE